MSKNFEGGMFMKELKDGQKIMNNNNISPKLKENSLIQPNLS